MEPARLVCLAASVVMLAAPARGAELTQTIERIKPSVVGVGTFLKTRAPSIQFAATGFVVADGRHVITNAHAVAKPLDTAKLEIAIVLVSKETANRSRAKPSCWRPTRSMISRCCESVAIRCRR